jgi:hypothetical protein
VDWISTHDNAGWTNNRSLRYARLRDPAVLFVNDFSLQEFLNETNHLIVSHVFTQLFDQEIMGYGVEVGFQVNVYCVLVSRLYQTIHASQRVFTTPVGAKAVALCGELPFRIGSST